MEDQVVRRVRPQVTDPNIMTMIIVRCGTEGKVDHFDERKLEKELEGETAIQGSYYRSVHWKGSRVRSVISNSTRHFQCHYCSTYSME